LHVLYKSSNQNSNNNTSQYGKVLKGVTIVVLQDHLNMKMLKLVALLAVVFSVSGYKLQELKDAETEYLKRSIIRRVKEKFEHRLADASKGVENNDIIDGNAAAEINIKDDASSRDPEAIGCCPIIDCTMTAGYVIPKPFSLENVIHLGFSSSCIRECSSKRRSIPSISAIVTNASGQCYCMKGSNLQRLPYNEFQSCILKTMSVAEWRKTQG